jgi:DNA-binding transcriptional LysR family regulator
LDWLETFLAVVDRGGFTAASAQIHRSQSRVSAHIAALERDLGVRLIDRSRRPASVTVAGRVFADHARDILAQVGSARSAIGLLRAMEEESLAVLTTPCIGAALFPGVLNDLQRRHSGARLSLSERGWPDGQSRYPDEGFVLAVLPTPTQPFAPELAETLLWRESIQVVVPADHGLARAASAVDPARLSRYPLVVTGASAAAEPEVTALLSARGLDIRPWVSVDSVQTMVAMVRRGVGVGMANAVALGPIETSDLAVLDLDDPDLIREVAVYWYDALLSTDAGRALHMSVLEAPVPAGATALPRGVR